MICVAVCDSPQNQFKQNVDHGFVLDVLLPGAKGAVLQFFFYSFWMGSVAPFEEILSRICILLKMIGVCCTNTRVSVAFISSTSAE